MVKKIQINLSFSNKFLYAMVLVVLIGIAGVGVYAYNSVTSPSIMGHSLNEVELPNCAVGQALVKNTSGWTCGSLSCSWVASGAHKIASATFVQNGGTGTCRYSSGVGITKETYFGIVKGGTATIGYYYSQGSVSRDDPYVYCEIQDEDGSAQNNLDVTATGVDFEYYACK